MGPGKPGLKKSRRGRSFGLSDQDILDTLSVTQKSHAWSHYRREVRRSQTSDGSKVITIVYRCRHNEPKHLTAHQRDRLIRAKMCLSAWADAPWFDYNAAKDIIAHSSRSLRPLRLSLSEESLS
ncbi:hypothetical protein C8Q72DRAFT_946201 [Fomitopsis betulina]|nr:hypothetical protein C8Q72DRAFT_946201 [Fomitopsis betulina]